MITWSMCLLSIFYNNEKKTIGTTVNNGDDDDDTNKQTNKQPIHRETNIFQEKKT